MTRGKYHVQAVNRLASLDNELLAEKMDELAAAHAQIAGLKRQLVRHQTDIDAEVVRRADELSAAQIAIAHQKVDDLVAEQTERNKRTTEWLVSHLVALSDANPDVKTLPVNIVEVLTELVGGENIGPYIVALKVGTSSRYNRRSDKKEYRFRKDAVRQLRGENPVLTKLKKKELE